MLSLRSVSYLILLAALTLFAGSLAQAQDTLTGAFEGNVTNSQTGAPLKGAGVEIINQQTGIVIKLQTDYRGRFYQGLLAPGNYIVRVSYSGYQTREVPERLRITNIGEVVPVPVALDPAPVAGAATPTPTPALTVDDTDVRASIVTIDGRRSGSFAEEEVSILPLAIHSSRTFDDLALLLPGVALPPQTLGNVAGPGVGAGVGSAGQFSVNGLRSRGNNFTVDGSDNNDEDIGVRRQGFVALAPQPIESIQEYQVITLLAPAQFGRNIGAQVNAVSKSGGSKTHGTVYGFFNSSQLNARNFFDTTNGNGTFPLTAGSNQPVVLCPPNNQRCIVNGAPSLSAGQQITVRNQSGGKDSFTFGQSGAVIGGRIIPDRLFYFFSVEGQAVNATREQSFAVPTVDQRGFNNTGATGIFQNPSPLAGGATFAYPATARGSALFSLYPFANNPQGVYGANTFTEVLPASERGKSFSARFEDLERIRGRHQSINGRYNFTDDWRDIPAVGGALFSAIRARVRAQNFSFWTNSELSPPAARAALFNQLRLSYGRTRLNFQELRDQIFTRPSDSLPNVPFLLNAPLILNTTLPQVAGGSQFVANTGPVTYSTDPAALRTEAAFGPIGQVRLAGFSPVGVDVFNFPQQRVNNTYQVADELTLRRSTHTLVFGVDVRRTELNSLLPRNARPLISFTGAPQISGAFNFDTHQFSNLAFTGKFIPAVNFAAIEGASGFTQTLAVGGESGINLRFYQRNFYGQDYWRARDNLSIDFGLRYEYNTPPRETSRRIENTFNDPSIALIPGLRAFIGNRTKIFDPDRNNFAPRIGVAFSPHLFGSNRTTVFRGGYGIFYDQILGSVVSQSRNVYPTYLTIDLAGGALPNFSFTGAGRAPGKGPCRPLQDPTGGIVFTNCFPFQFTNPQLSLLNGVPVVQPGTLNTLNPALSFAQLVQLFAQFGTGAGTFPAESSFGFTIPSQILQMPVAHHYDFTFEQQLRRNLVVSAAYVGTLGRHLLRFTTPNLGQDAFVAPIFFTANFFSDFGIQPYFLGLSLPPGTRIAPQGNGFVGGRPVNGVGAVNQFETTATSRYDSLQVQLRGRFHRGLQYQLAYTLSKATDDVSDVFDLAGASALPQDSSNFAAERGPANFDARHRLAYNFIYTFSRFADRGRAFRTLFGGLQLTGTGQFQTGQPFTVNSIFDVNLDGNLTDRLDNTNGIVVTGYPQQPLRLTTANTASMLAPVGRDGRVGRNTFRAGNLLDLNLAVVKSFSIKGEQKIIFRTEILNFINRANFGIPVRFLEAPGFGQATNTVTPARRIQFVLKYSF